MVEKERPLYNTSKLVQWVTKRKYLSMLLSLFNENMDLGIEPHDISRSHQGGKLKTIWKANTYKIYQKWWKINHLYETRASWSMRSLPKQRQDQYIRVTHLHNRFQTASVTAWTIPGLRRIHPRTVLNHLREHHICPHRPCVHMLLLPHHSAEYLQWSHAHLMWRLREWFSLDHSDGWIIVYLRAGECYQDACIRQRRAFGGGCVMVWGGGGGGGGASQPMAGHPWSLLMAIWMHAATWRRLLDRACCLSFTSEKEHDLSAGQC